MVSTRGMTKENANAAEFEIKVKPGLAQTIRLVDSAG